MAKSVHIIATARFFDEIVETRVLPVQREVILGGTETMALPLPGEGAFLARVLRKGGMVKVTDASGKEHVLSPGSDLVLEAGPVSLQLSMAPAKRLQRSVPWPYKASAAWFALVMLTSVVAQQSDLVYKHRCELFGVTPQLLISLDCVPPEGTAGGASGLTAEYLARLLKKDYAGEDDGILQRDRPAVEVRVEQPEQIYMPSGNEGPITKMEGAREVAPEAVKAPDAQAVKKKKKVAPKSEPLIAVTEPDAPKSDEIIEEPSPAADAIADAEANDEADQAAPAEEEEGWGLQDWYDNKDRSREELEVTVALEVSKRRLRIDPNDLEALSVLSYYQYLASQYDDAIQTYDKYISLNPDDPAGYNNKALIYKRRADYKTEEALLRTALALEPGDVTALNNLGVCLSHQGRFNEALEVMRQLEKLDPGDPYADLHRSKIYAEQGDDAAALRYLEKALSGMKQLDTLHHIEFRQDIRIDPSFARLRKDPAFHGILVRYYGDANPLTEGGR